MKTILSLMFGLVLGLSSTVSEARIDLPSMSNFNPEILKIKEDDFLGKIAPDISFVTEKGETMSLSRLTDKPLILLLVYYDCPVVCTMLGDGLSSALKGMNDLKVGRDFNVLALSFNEKDTPEKAREYHQKLFERSAFPGLDQWVFATTDEETVRKISEATGYRFFYSVEDQTFVHSVAYIFLSPQRKITRYLFGVRPDTFDVRMAVLESLEGRTGKLPLSALVTYACYRYDPGSRSYIANMPVIFAAVGILMAVMTGLISLVIYRKRWRRSHAAF